MAEHEAGAEGAEAAAAAAAAAAGTQGGDVNDKAWLTSVPTELRGHEVFTELENPAGAFKLLTELHEGAKKHEGMVAIPNDQSPKEEVTAFYQKMGWPAQPGGYKLGKPNNAPEGFVYDEKFEAGYRETAHGLGMTEHAANAMYGFLTNRMVSDFSSFNDTARAELEKEQTTGDKALADKWGMDTARNTKLAERAMKALTSDGFRKMVDEYGMNSHPEMKKFFYSEAQRIGDDVFIRADRSGEGLSDRERLRLRFPDMPDEK